MKAADLYAKYIVNNNVTDKLRKLGAKIHYHWAIIAYLDQATKIIFIIYS